MNIKFLLLAFVAKPRANVAIKGSNNVPQAAIVTEIDSIVSSVSQNDPAFESKYKFVPTAKLNHSHNESMIKLFMKTTHILPKR